MEAILGVRLEVADWMPKDALAFLGLVDGKPHITYIRNIQVPESHLKIGDWPWPAPNRNGRP